jgi:hypothetical protein
VGQSDVGEPQRHRLCDVRLVARGICDLPSAPLERGFSDRECASEGETLSPDVRSAHGHLGSGGHPSSNPGHPSRSEQSRSLSVGVVPRGEL